MTHEPADNLPWYAGVTRYQWLVLLIASLGWIFDVFEGQIFVASMNEAMPSLAPEASEGDLAYFNNITLGAFLLGGALGGVMFGMLSDRIGRTRTMMLTIVMYSLFTFVTAFAQSWWHMALFRFLVAMGVGGEWAVASAMVAEVFPKRARAWSLGIFHASSVLGTYLAIAAGAFIIGNPALQSADYPSLPWRIGFALGVLPALLIIWIRWSLREPEQWERARSSATRDLSRKLGSFTALFAPDLARNTLVGVGLAAVGLATFWGAHIYGKDILREAAGRQQSAARVLAVDEPYTPSNLIAPPNLSAKHWEMVGMFLVTTGGGLGLVCFGPLCERLGRRGAFVFYHVGGLVCAVALFQVLANATIWRIMAFLPLFGFLTLGMHAGYAIYFPELYPTRLRGTGGGFCFNVGRIMAAPTLFAVGWIQREWEVTLPQAAAWLSGLYLLGALLALAGPETRGRELPE